MMIQLLLLAPLALAGSTTQSRKDARELYPLIRAQAQSAQISCEGEECVIGWTEKRGKPVQFEDKKKKRDAAKTALRALAEKLRNGTITAVEKDQLLAAVADRLLED